MKCEICQRNIDTSALKIAKAGGATRVAKAVGIHRTTVYAWIKNNRIPTHTKHGKPAAAIVEQLIQARDAQTNPEGENHE